MAAQPSALYPEDAQHAIEIDGSVSFSHTFEIRGSRRIGGKPDGGKIGRGGGHTQN